MSQKSNSFRPEVESLENRLVPTSILNLQSDVFRLVADLPGALVKAGQGGVDIFNGWETRNPALSSRGWNEYYAAVGEIRSDYQQIQNDLSVPYNMQAASANLPARQRITADGGIMEEGGFIAVYGMVTGNGSVMRQGINIVVGAVEDIGAALGQSWTNTLNTAPQFGGLDTFGYDPNASKD